MRFTDEQLVNLKARYKDHTAHCRDCECSFGNLELPAILMRLEVAERAVDEASCLLDHPAFTVGTRSQELLPQGMAARAKSAREAINVWVKAAGRL